MEKLSTTEVVSYLKRLAREYQYLEKALDLAEAVNTANTDLKKLQDHVYKLEEYKEALNKELDIKEQALNEASSKEKEMKSTIEKRLLEAEKEIKSQKVKAKEEISKLERASNARIENLNKEIKNLSAERNKALDAKVLADEQLKEVQDKIKQTKQAFIESL